jgi:hypothetical protein
VDLVDQSDAAPFLLLVDEHSAPVEGNEAHGFVQLIPAIAAFRSQHIPGQALGVDTDQDGILKVEIAGDQGNGFLSGHGIAKTIDREFPEAGG